MTALEVVDAGLLTTIQDAGRPGLAHMGVPRSGAADAASYAQANAVVGNPPGCAVLETTLTGCVLRARHRMVLAVTGAICPVFVEDFPAPHGRAFHVDAGQQVRVGAARHGARSYVAVRGGVEGPAELGSRATCMLTGLGPAPLVAGDVLAVGAHPGEVSGLATASVSADSGTDLAAVAASGEHVISVRLGPRHDFFTPEALTTLQEASYVASPESNRVGLRLEGAPLERREQASLPSEGMVVGAVQVPPAGQPIVFLADHPVTGGYPVIAVATAQGVSWAAQVPPGATVRFVVEA